MNPTKRKILSAIYFILFLFIFIGFEVYVSHNKSEEKWFYINKTESVATGVYLKIPESILFLQGRNINEYRVGDYVVFTPNEQALQLATERKYIDKDTTYFLKKIGGLYGDTWAVKAITNKYYLFFINHNLYGEVLQKDKMGNPMPINEGVFLVPKEYFLPYGDAERSFDGRYTGVVKLSNIKSIVKPIYTGLHW